MCPPVILVLHFHREKEIFKRTTESEAAGIS